MESNSLLRNNEIKISDHISVYVPTVGEIYDMGEDEYYNIAQLLTCVPYDLMAQLDDMGIDYEQITEYQLFVMLLQSFILNGKDISSVLRCDNLDGLKIMENTDSKEMLLVNNKDEVVINVMIQRQIAAAIRRIHFWKKTEYKAGNAEAKKYILERTKLKLKRAAKKPHHSFLDENIIALVNTEEFKYNYESVMDLNIYKLNASIHQIVHKKNYDEMMMGVYFGTIDAKTLDMQKIHWMSSLHE